MSPARADSHTDGPGPRADDHSAPAQQRPGTMSELTREECLALLVTAEVGRIAVTLGERTPVIRPVNYIFDVPSQSVVFRTGRGSKLEALVHAASAKFEVDDLDPAARSGWSVILAGAIDEITEHSEVARLEGLGLQPWPDGPRPHWIRIRARTVSGRRIDSSAG